MQAANDSADDSARHGHNQEKEKNPATEIKIFPLEKLFQRKMITSESAKTSIVSKNCPNRE